jgi:hypothetical protein
MNPNAIIHEDLEQGTPEWLAARRGLMTASEMNLVLTPTLKPSNNEKTRAHIYEIAAQRITEWTEPTYVGDAMLRGHADEITARDLYSDRYEPVEEKGFITRDFGGFTLGYSPDGCGVMSNIGIECKSRIQKHHLATIISDTVPVEYMLQVQTGLLVTEWDYMDYISFCAGLPMWVIRVFPDPVYQDAIMTAAADFELKVREQVAAYQARINECAVFITTEREPDEMEVFVG